MEHFRGKILGVQSRSFMNEQIPQGDIGIADIRLEDMGTKEVVQIAAGRMLFKKGSVLMARAVKGIILFTDILYEFPKKGWQYILFIIAGQAFCRFNTAALIDDFLRKDDVDLIQILGRQLFATRHDYHNGHAKPRCIDRIDIIKILIRKDGNGNICKIGFFDRHDFPVTVNKIVLYVKAVRNLHVFHMLLLLSSSFSYGLFLAGQWLRQRNLAFLYNSFPMKTRKAPRH